ncbi:MAG: multicopper oxidase domain-containing protein [Terracidiphilus sp.]
MDSKSRRDFLRLAVASVSALVFGRNASAQDGEGSVQTPRSYRTLDRLDRYIDPLPVPERLNPLKARKTGDLYRVRMLESSRQMHSQLPPTKFWGYEGRYPGPAFEAMRGRPVQVEWENRLPLQHIFPVDAHIHGAMPPAPDVRTVPHLHGARTSSFSDGLPEKWFVPGQSVRFSYPNDQRAATLWYHDHALGITRLNVYAGLSGFYLLRDEQELAMNLPSGDYEIPLSLQDRTLDDHGQLVYAPTQEGGVALPQGVWGPQLFGNLPVVNGAIYPYFNVEPRMYRFRLLNASNARFFNLYLNLAKSSTDIPSLLTFQQIGGDGGLLERPVPLERLLLAPAERADLIVDFSRLAGRTITLMNSAMAPYPGWNLLRAIYPPLNELMQFRVILPFTAVRRSFSMAAPIPLPRLNPAQSVATRDFVLTERMDAQGRSLGMLIDHKGYSDPTTEFPKSGTMEKWRFINMTDDAHPMHVHLVQFQILERQGFDYGSFLQGNLEFVGKPRPPAANEAGWKDTAIVNPRDVLTILVPFTGGAGRYVFHCHVAEHEDNDMMRPFEVV